MRRLQGAELSQSNNPFFSKMKKNIKKKQVNAYITPLYLGNVMMASPAGCSWAIEQGS